MLLVSGKRMEALQCAQKGHLWGPAIAIATLLGEQVLKMHFFTSLLDTLNEID